MKRPENREEATSGTENKKEIVEIEKEDIRS